MVIRNFQVGSAYEFFFKDAGGVKEAAPVFFDTVDVIPTIHAEVKAFVHSVAYSPDSGGKSMRR